MRGAAGVAEGEGMTRKAKTRTIDGGTVTWQSQPVAQPMTDKTDYPAMLRNVEHVLTLIEASVDKPLAVAAGVALLKHFTMARQYVVSVTLPPQDWQKMPGVRSRRKAR